MRVPPPPSSYPVGASSLTTDTQAKPLSKRFGNPALYEVMRIIPLTMRITRYSRAPAAWPGRPTIHVTGDWHTATAEPELARVRGTVEMTASGDIRWTMVRNYFFTYPLHRFSMERQSHGEKKKESIDIDVRFFFLVCASRYRSERTERASGLPRACSSAGAARPWG